MVKAQTKKATAALNRGAWTPEEDKKLVECVRLHGDHKWRTIPEKAGLKRCGKSCRLRWLNYLSPNIKRGNITKDEEELIIRLHNLLGNKWSLIAGRLPGRTDNEIKNYWNAHLSSRTLSTNDLNRKLFVNSNFSCQPLQVNDTAAVASTLARPLPVRHSNFSCQPLQVNDTAAVASTLARPLPVRLARRQKSPNHCTASVAAIIADENDITVPASATLAVGGSGLISATMQLSTPELIDSHHVFNGMAQLIDAHEALDGMAQPLDLADHTNRQIGAGGDGATEALEKDGKGVWSLDGLDMWLSGWEFDDMDNIIGCELGDELAPWALL